MNALNHHLRSAAARSLGLATVISLASPAAGQILVPTLEVPDIETAYDSAWEGATISLSAGSHTIDATLDAEGMNLHVVGQVDAAGVPLTTIDGEGLRRILAIRNGESTATVYENIRFANGLAFGENGGAIQIFNADPRFINCVFEGNQAAYKGGAMHVYGAGAEVAIIGCQFVSNVVAGGNAGVGGGLALEQQSVVQILESTFRQNRAGFGGGIWGAGITCRLEHSVFQGNVASSNAGAVLINGGDLKVQESRFDDNRAAALQGGAMMLVSARTQIEKCWFDGNASGLSGGALQTSGPGGSCLIGRSEFSDNTAGGEGGALSVQYTPTVVSESYLFGNSATRDGGAIDAVNAEVRLERVAGFGNLAGVGGFLRQNGGQVELVESEITGNTAAVAGGLRLMGGGTTDLWESSVCENHDEQILGLWNDLGDNCVAEICGCACPADLDGDGVVNGSDFGLLITAWGSGSGPADLDGDGRVDALDLGLLFAAWGPCR